MITLVRAIRTSIACPAQWDAWDADGQYYYLRFRHGCGVIARYRDEHWCDRDDEPWPPTPEMTVATFETEHEWDEEWEADALGKFTRLAGVQLSPDLDTTSYWRNIHNRLAEEFKDDPAALARADQLLGGINLDSE